jgi:hypothetical protein
MAAITSSHLKESLTSNVTKFKLPDELGEKVVSMILDILGPIDILQLIASDAKLREHVMECVVAISKCDPSEINSESLIDQAKKTLDKQDVPCVFNVKPDGCKNGDNCLFSHKPLKPVSKAGAKPCSFFSSAGGCNKSKDCKFSHDDVSGKTGKTGKSVKSVKSGKAEEPQTTVTVKKQCSFFSSVKGCFSGSGCKFSHDKSSSESDKITESVVETKTGTKGRLCFNLVKHNTCTAETTGNCPCTNHNKDEVMAFVKTPKGEIAYAKFLNHGKK